MVYHVLAGKNRKRGTNKNDPVKRELILKEEGQEYAQCTKMLGNGRIEVACFDGVKRLATIRGKMRKKVWVNVGDIVLLGLRDFQDTKADVILKYMPDEARQLQKQGEIPVSAKINEEESNTGQGWEFDDDGGDDSESDSDDDRPPANGIVPADDDSDDGDVDVDAI
jgi:translation initiation factor 1A